MMRPPDVTTPTEPGGGVGVGKAGAVGYYEADYAPEPTTAQAAVPFSEMVLRATPSELLHMLAIHRRFLPDEPIPFALHRAIAGAWARGAR